jgi:hypothetical protein
MLAGVAALSKAVAADTYQSANTTGQLGDYFS